ncbi:hypothetical protein [Nocardia gipuzkoensis]|uniref:hypothetical protein n=1 Tax=Nocardia gipuzkoensis TaxID=2749991 RepID=UPI00237E99DA|nr:hypothetical protein [Nocardia gipuzkoensis]MDE1675457.1 hypothetical protein [Nocardia gipuzkoensis]
MTLEYLSEGLMDPDTAGQPLPLVLVRTTSDVQILSMTECSCYEALFEVLASYRSPLPHEGRRAITEAATSAVTWQALEPATEEPQDQRMITYRVVHRVRQDRGHRAAAQAAAGWWAQQLSAPTFITPASGQPVHPAQPSAVVSAGLRADAHTITSDQLAAFTARLTEAIYAELTACHRTTLRVDYHPDGTLAAAADAAGIDLSRLPWKSASYADADHVTTVCGDGAVTQVLWHVPGWVHPPCGFRLWDAATAGYQPHRCGRAKYHQGEHGDWNTEHGN